MDFVIPFKINWNLPLPGLRLNFIVPQVFGKSVSSRAFPIHKQKGQSRIFYNDESDDLVNIWKFIRW